MGKNYSEISYKKGYDGEYVKSYRIDTRAVNATYRRQEKGLYDGLNTDSGILDVLTEPRQPPSRIQRSAPRQPKAPVPQLKVQQPAREQEVKVETPFAKPTVSQPKVKEEAKPIIIAPPPYTPPQPKAQVKEKPVSKPSRNYDLYRVMVMAPIIPMENGKYRELAGKETIDEVEARKILDIAGYTVKPQLNLLAFFAVALIFGIPLTIFGPIVIAVYGLLVKSKSKTTHSKQLTMSTLSVSLPATAEEQASYVKRGQLYINTAIAIGVIQFITYFT